MIEGILFDLDGTLINSEPLWQEAEIEIFRTESLHLTTSDLAVTKGLKSIEVVNFHLQKVHQPKRSAIEINTDIVNKVIELAKERIELKSGALQLLNLLQDTGIPMAIASTSPFRFIQIVIEKLQIQPYFKFLYSSDFEQYSKPHPAIYLSAAEKLGVDPLKALAFEDSFNGILAAKAARIKTIALLDEGQINDTKFDFADLKIESFHNFGASELEEFNNSI